MFIAALVLHDSKQSLRRALESKEITLHHLQRVKENYTHTHTHTQNANANSIAVAKRSRAPGKARLFVH